MDDDPELDLELTLGAVSGQGAPSVFLYVVQERSELKVETADMERICVFFG